MLKELAYNLYVLFCLLFPNVTDSEAHRMAMIITVGLTSIIIIGLIRFFNKRK